MPLEEIVPGVKVSKQKSVPGKTDRRRTAKNTNTPNEMGELFRYRAANIFLDLFQQPT